MVWLPTFTKNKSKTQRFFFENAMKQCKFRELGGPSTEADKQGSREKHQATSQSPPKHHDPTTHKNHLFQPPSTGKDNGVFHFNNTLED